ncbi:hypothetical protein A7C91_03110 [Thermococcus piezophilus]|uniref:CGP-CTERM sorting domain-containing protein n=1 Tax=Thermococcus piezophilus TaxID=1712654 RepID=A0A172WFT6_9EURY|nr:hypothetical protein A7C91_03110 [Thermococcus piezophilus]
MILLVEGTGGEEVIPTETPTETPSETTITPSETTTTPAETTTPGEEGGICGPAVLLGLALAPLLLRRRR